MKKISVIITMVLMLMPIVNSTALLSKEDNSSFPTNILDDLDPLVDLSVTVEIKQIRTLEKTDLGIKPIDKIDLFSDPDFYVKVFINDEEFISQTWYDTKYVYTPWSATADVPDDIEWVNITIELWDADPSGDTLCDLSGFTEEDDDSQKETQLIDNRYVSLQYNLKSGHWTGDDHLELNTNWGMSDTSGYGRLNGCDDGSIYQNDRDCELWFDIHQNDYDGDGIPYWTEVNAFSTDPSVDNTGENVDNDGVPIEWEWKWGYYTRREYHSTNVSHAWIYHPLISEDHLSLDDDEDGLDNVEEYLTSQWDSDPYRKDLFVELDQMAAGPNGEEASILSVGSKELLRTAYNKHNIVYHLDDGSWENSGSDMIPFDNLTTMAWGNQFSELYQIYNAYFLHDDITNWRQGVFHYGAFVYQCSAANGNAFGGNRYQISSNGLKEKAKSLPWLDEDIVLASAYMHECGHTLNLENPGVDDQMSKFPWQVNWWKWRPYKSVMNYGYMFTMVDYSDGSRGKNDFNDWQNMDLTAFQQNWW
ncbi:MAG: hypothetical protein V1769_06305 [Thermoplasmatota archaeon]